MQAMLDFVAPERRLAQHAVLTSDELMMLTDFSDASASLLSPKSPRSLYPRGTLAIIGLALSLITAIANPLNEREGLWTPQTSKGVAVAEATPGWQAFRNWQTGTPLANDIPLAIGLPTAPTLFQTPLTNFVLLTKPSGLNPSGPTVSRGETSMPEPPVNPAPTTLAKTTVPSAPAASPPVPSFSTANVSKTTPAPNSGSLFSSLFNGLNPSTPSSPGQTNVKSAMAVANNATNTGPSYGGRAEAKSSSNSSSNGDSHSGGRAGSGGGPGSGGTRRS
jgi:hypothetical protein